MAIMRPTNREEKLLAKIAGESYEVEPRNAEEYWLNKIAESRGGGGGGGGGTGFEKLEYTVSEGTATLQATFAELTAMVAAGTIPYILKVTDYGGGYVETYILFLYGLNDAADEGKTAYFGFGSIDTYFEAADANTNMTKDNWS